MTVNLFTNALAVVLSTTLEIYGDVALKMEMFLNVTIVKYS
jgi:hypothetical protein